MFWLAFGVGAMHAVAPRHGKTVTAAYLVGTRGQYRDAARLGVIVAIMHTFSVLVLALVWVGVKGVASMGPRPSRLVLAFGVGMAVTLTAVGIATLKGFSLLAGRVSRWGFTALLPLAAGVAVAVGGCVHVVLAVRVLTG